jgi:transcriptional regulator with XRE-family HTH domain
MRLKKICDEKGLTFKELSDKSGLSLVYLYELERGDKQNPSLKTVNKIADALEVNISQLLDSA